MMNVLCLDSGSKECNRDVACLLCNSKAAVLWLPLLATYLVRGNGHLQFDRPACSHRLQTQYHRLEL